MSAIFICYVFQSRGLKCSFCVLEGERGDGRNCSVCYLVFISYFTCVKLCNLQSHLSAAYWFITSNILNVQGLFYLHVFFSVFSPLVVLVSLQWILYAKTRSTKYRGIFFLNWNIMCVSFYKLCMFHSMATVLWWITPITFLLFEYKLQIM